MPSKHHILLFGGTGNCGQIFARAALLAGHELTLYVRTPSKLSPELAEHENIHIIQGEFNNTEGLQKAAQCGADVFISLAGPTLGRREGTPITDALKNFYPLLLTANPRIRILVLSTASYSVNEDSRSIKWFFAIQGYIRTIGGDSYAEVNGLSKQTVQLGEHVDWTLFRVPLLNGDKLTGKQVGLIDEFHQGGLEAVAGDREERDSSANEDMAKVHAAFVGDKKGRDWLFLDRGRLALWILGELEERRWIRACPTLANS